MTDRNDTDDGSTDPFGEPPAPGERVERSADGSALVREHVDGSATFAIDPESDTGTEMLRMADEFGEDPEEFILKAVNERLDCDDDGRGTASEQNPDLDPDEPESYHPAMNLTPAEIDRATRTLSDADFEQMNRISSSAIETEESRDLDDAERVLVSLADERAEQVMHIAWTIDREPNEVLDEMVWHGQVDYEDVFDLREY